MAEFFAADFLAAIACPLLAGLAVSALIELGVALRHGKAGFAAFLSRPWQAWVVHCAIMVTLFNVELIVFHRPWFAFSQMIVLHSVMLIVSAAKEFSLREPFVYQDLYYFTDMLKYPRLYLPFFGYTKLVALLGGVGVVIYFGMTLEISLLDRMPTLMFLLSWLCFYFFVKGVLRLTRLHDFTLTFDPMQDLRRLGMMANLVAYARAEEQDKHFAPVFSTHVRDQGGELPNIVAVQSESFFDVRKMGVQLNPDIYAWLDRSNAESRRHGRMAVPAWGANTVRTEFAFLSGLSDQALGVHRFNPYRKIAHRGAETVALYLRAQGYRTVCIHPYTAKFYERDLVMPMLGFDEFIDVASFTAADCSGPYVGDVALAERVTKVLAESETRGQPVFVFAITMENHGPLHLEKATAEEAANTYAASPPPCFDDLTVYLRHVRNAGRMCDILKESLATQKRSGLLCWYGDHVPILPAIYKYCNYDDARTEYFIWATAQLSNGEARNIPVTDLARDMLCQAGWRMDAFEQASSSPA